MNILAKKRVLQKGIDELEKEIIDRIKNVNLSQSVYRYLGYFLRPFDCAEVISTTALEVLAYLLNDGEFKSVVIKKMNNFNDSKNKYLEEIEKIKHEIIEKKIEYRKFLEENNKEIKKQEKIEEHSRSRISVNSNSKQYDLQRGERNIYIPE
jgi:hypothetical protein